MKILKTSKIILVMLIIFITGANAAETGDALQLLSYRAEAGSAPDVTDGVIAPIGDPTDWRSAYVRYSDFDVDGVISAPKQTSMLFCNDADFLYVALAVPLDNAANGNRITIYFDQDTKGVLDTDGDYFVSMLADGTAPYDGYWDGTAWVQNPAPAVQGIGLRKGTGSPSLYNYELKIPLNPGGDASNNYMNINAGDEIGAMFVVQMATGGNDEYIWVHTNADNTDPSATGANGSTGWSEIKTIGDGIADRNMVSLAAKGILPTIDGNVSNDPEWKYAFSKDVIFTDYNGNKLNGTIKLKEEYGPDRIIVGIVIENYTPAAADFLSFYNDQGAAGSDRNFILNTAAVFDNAVRMSGDGTMQDYNFNTGNWVADGTLDGSGAAVSGTDWEIELEVPFTGDGTEDLDIAPQDILGALFHLYDSTNDINYWLSSTINSESIVIDPVDPVYNALGWLKLQTGGPFVQSIYPENGDTISGEYPLAVYTVDPTDPVPELGINNVTYEVRLEDTAAGIYTVLTSGALSKIEDDNIPIWTGTFDTRSITVDPSTLLKLVYIIDDGEIDPVSVPLDIYINNEGGVTLSDPECIISTPLPHAEISGSGNSIQYTASTDTLLTLTNVRLYIDGEMVSENAVSGDYTYAGNYTWDTSGLEDGEHVIQVWAENSLNISNYSATTLVYTKNSPSISLTSPASSSVVSGVTTVEFSANPVAPATLVTTEISIDGATWTAVTGQPVAAGGTGSHTWDTTDIPDGTHEIIIRTTDNGGRTAYSDDLNIITKNDPNVAITSPAASSVLGGIVNVEFEAYPVDPAVLSTTEISLDGGAWTAVTGQPVAAGGTGLHTWDTTDIPDGTHEIIIRTTDNGGRTAYSEDLNIITDNMPNVTISSPEASALVHETITVEFEAYPVDPAVLSTTEISIDGSSWTAVTNEPASTGGAGSHELDTSGLKDGTHQIIVRSTDDLNRIGYSEDLLIITDNTSPLGEVTADPVNVKNGDTVTFKYYGYEPSLSVTITLAELELLDNGDNASELTLSDGDTDGVYTAQYIISGNNTVADGMKTLTFTVEDEVGNIHSPKVSLRLDNSLPEATLEIYPEPKNNEVYVRDILLECQYEDAPDSQYVESIVIKHMNEYGGHINNSPFNVEPSDDMFFSREISLIDGENRINIIITDMSGNELIHETVLNYEDPRITNIVGEDGGTVTSPDGTTVIIPEGALLNEEEITIRTVSTEGLPATYNGIELLKTAHQFGPENLIFHEPVTVTLAYNDFDLDLDLDGNADLDEDNLDVFTLEGNTWIKTKAVSVNTAENTVEFTTNHFSVYALGNQNITEEFKFYWTKNPFTAQGTTTAVVDLEESGKISLNIYDLTGDLVRILADEMEVAGTTNIKWDGKNDYDRYVGSGIYIYVFEFENAAGDKEVIKKPVGVIK